MAENLINSCLIITFARNAHLDELIANALSHCERVYIYQNQSNPKFEMACKDVDKTIKKYMHSKVTVFKPLEHLPSEQSIVYAITKFFEFEKNGTIFEDDCIPSKLFWRAREFFVREVLDDNTFIFNGFTPVPRGKSLCEISRKKYVHVWGWTTNALTWKRFLSNYEIEGLKIRRILETGLSLKSSLYWFSIFRLVSIGIIKTWDYKFLYFTWMQNIKIYGPSENFVHNKGADEYSQFLKDNSAEVQNIRVSTYVSEFKNNLAKADKSEILTNAQHYKITWTRIIILLLINLKALFNQK